MSSSLVPEDDSSLLFTNAGMVQFKDVFTGRETRPYTRAVSIQRCLRAGGKHNDLDNVGFTPRHHTFFEMLGNFSFGDYFKKDAIRWSWEFLTEVLEIPSHKLVVSVFNGEGMDIPPDEEAYELWAEIIPKERIYSYPAKENFWQMGETGPCGPCSEIHIFQGEGNAPCTGGQLGKGPAFEGNSYVELWNLVFMQYEKLDDSSVVKLLKPSVDTGAGLERLTAVAEGVKSNYETSLFQPIVRYSKGLVKNPEDSLESSFQVLADHARASVFLIRDGVLPGKTGRSYVLRRIIRRAIRHGKLVGFERPFFHLICNKVIDLCISDYPELDNFRSNVLDCIQEEELLFRKTLSKGLKRIRKTLRSLPKDISHFPVDLAAQLYDTYGFPIDLTKTIVEEKGLQLEEKEVELFIRNKQLGNL